MAFTRDEIPTMERYFERAIQCVRHAQSSFELFQFFDDLMEERIEAEKLTGSYVQLPSLTGASRACEISVRELDQAISILVKLKEALG